MTIDPYAWKLDYDSQGKLVVLPVENYPIPQGGETLPKKRDPALDPEHARAMVAGLGR